MRLRRLFRMHPINSAATVIFTGSLVAFTVFGGEQVASGQAATRSVWDGVFTSAQAERGRGFFLASCAECHGAELQGGQNEALKGDRFWAGWQETTVDYMLDRISKNMPFAEDGSLAGTLGMSTYVDIVSHILNANGFPAGPGELTEKSSVGVQIVKKEGGELPSDSFGHVVGCLVRGPDRAWRLQRASRPVRVLADKPVDVNAPLGDREYVLKFVLTSLDKYAGYRMSVRATLMGDGGSGGLNVRTIDPVTQACQ